MTDSSCVGFFARDTKHGCMCSEEVGDAVRMAGTLHNRVTSFIHHSRVGSSSPLDEEGPGSELQWSRVQRHPQNPAANALDQELKAWRKGERTLLDWETTRSVVCSGTCYAHPDPTIGFLYPCLTILRRGSGGKISIDLTWIDQHTALELGLSERVISNTP